MVNWSKNTTPGTRRRGPSPAGESLSNQRRSSRALPEVCLGVGEQLHQKGWSADLLKQCLNQSMELDVINSCHVGLTLLHTFLGLKAAEIEPHRAVSARATPVEDFKLTSRIGIPRATPYTSMDRDASIPIRSSSRACRGNITEYPNLIHICKCRAVKVAMYSYRYPNAGESGFVYNAL